MDNYHIIIGYGKWAKKIITFLKKKNFFSKIYIKTRYKYFEYGKNENISKNKFIKIRKEIRSIHICTPVNSHFYYLNKYINLKKIIVEKPFLKNLSQLKKIQNIHSNKNLLLVNYTYLFNPILNKLKKKININSNDKIIINFTKKNNFYKKKYDCINDWLDHPLSIILFIFKNFTKFKIVKKEFFNKKGFYEKLVINYLYKKLTVQININCSTANKKNILVISNSKKTIYDLNSNSIFLEKKKFFFSNKNSFDMLYSTLKNNKKLSFQNFKFHRGIMKEKNKILKKIVNDQ